MQTLFCARCSRPIEGQAVQGPAGWSHPSCAGSSRTGSALPLLAAVGCGVPAGLGMLGLIFLAIWQFLSPTSPAGVAAGRTTAHAAAADAGDDDALTERYPTTNGMLAAHYPASFAASPLGDSAVKIQRVYPDGNVAAVVLESVETPVSTDIKEVDRLLVAAEAKLLHGYVVETRRAATCLGKPGLEVIAATTADNGVPYTRRACRFLTGGHFYSFSYTLPKDQAAEGAPLLQGIIEATELLR
jgi:hypothetical protein